MAVRFVRWHKPMDRLDTALSKQGLEAFRKLVDIRRALVIVTHGMPLAARTDRRIHAVGCSNATLSS
jgi:ABC-type lipoprotein export system ATPase subunit